MINFASKTEYFFLKQHFTHPSYLLAAITIKLEKNSYFKSEVFLYGYRIVSLWQILHMTHKESTKSLDGSYTRNISWQEYGTILALSKTITKGRMGFAGHGYQNIRVCI